MTTKENTKSVKFAESDLAKGLPQSFIQFCQNNAVRLDKLPKSKQSALATTYRVLKDLGIPKASIVEACNSFVSENARREPAARWKEENEKVAELAREVTEKLASLDIFQNVTHGVFELSFILDVNAERDPRIAVHNRGFQEKSARARVPNDSREYVWLDAEGNTYASRAEYLHARGEVAKSPYLYQVGDTLKLILKDIAEKSDKKTLARAHAANPSDKPIENI